MWIYRGDTHQNELIIRNDFNFVWFSWNSVVLLNSQVVLKSNKVLKLDTQRIRLLKLRINAETVKYSIAESREVSKIKLNQIQIKNEQVNYYYWMLNINVGLVSGVCITHVIFLLCVGNFSSSNKCNFQMRDGSISPSSVRYILDQNLFSKLIYFDPIFKDQHCTEDWTNTNQMEHFPVHFVCQKDSKCGNYSL